jgi:hypothetical protein
MFYRFNAHRARKPVESSENRLARQIYQKLISLQRSWAGLMGAGAEKLTSGWLKILCVTVITVSSGYSAYLIFEGFISINEPFTYGQALHLWPFDPYGTKQQLRAKASFNLYLDSLENAVNKDSLNQSNHTQK